MNNIAILEQIRKLTNVNNLNNNADLIFKLGQIRGICDQAIAENSSKVEPVFVKADDIIHIDIDEPEKTFAENSPKVLVASPDKTAKLHKELIRQIQNSDSIGILSEAEKNYVENDVKTFAEKCKEIIPEDKPCTDDDEKIIKLLERNGSHMNLKFELSQRFPNKQYAKTVYNLLAKDGICTMQDLMEIFDDYEKLHIIKYYQSAKKDDLKKLNEIFPVFELGDITCNKIAAMYEAANEYHGRTGGDILTNFIGDKLVRHRNAIMRFGILNMNQLYYYFGHHTLKEYKGIRNVGVVPDNVLWLYNYINNTRKVVK